MNQYLFIILVAFSNSKINSISLSGKIINLFSSLILLANYICFNLTSANLLLNSYTSSPSITDFSFEIINLLIEYFISFSYETFKNVLCNVN
jgi:hypothetical protein